MALVWTNKVNGIDDIDASDVNALAAAVIANENAINGKAGTANSLSGYGITDAYTKSEIDGKVVGLYRFRGSKNNYDELLSVSLPQSGDVYNVIDRSDVIMHHNTLVSYDWLSAGMEGEYIEVTFSSVNGFLKGEYIGIYDDIGQNLGFLKVGDVNSQYKTVTFVYAETNSETIDTLEKLGVAAGQQETNNQGFYAFSFNGRTFDGSSKITQICRAGENIAYVKDGTKGYWDVFGGSIDMSGYYTRDEANAITDPLYTLKADSATTLSGYGITDAYTKEQVDAAIAAAIAAHQGV